MKHLLLILIAFFAASAALAGNEAQNKLISSDVRPTPAEIMSQEEHFADIISDFRFATQYQEDIPKVIVGLEKAFPGGTYAFLGRDMDLVADAVEAFYLSIGQKDRVQRIRFSTPSMAGATPALITDFLIQSGLNADPNVHKPPMVIVDYTSFRSTSQSTTILKLALTELENRGIPAYDVMTRLNIATIHYSVNVSTYDTISLPIKSLETKLEAQNILWATKHRITGIFRIPVGHIAYGSEWHEHYGPIMRNAEGVLETKPARYFGTYEKGKVFNKMADAIMISTSEDFKNKVTELAIKNSVQITGLNTPAFERSAPRTPEEIANAIAEKKRRAVENRLAKVEAVEKTLIETLNDFHKKLTPLPPDTKHDYSFFWTERKRIGLSINGLYFGYELMKTKHVLAPHFQQIALENLVQLYQDGKITAQDLQLIFMVSLRAKKITDPDFVRAFQANYQNLLPLEIAIGKPDIREQYMKLRGNMGDNYRLLTNKGTLPLSCKFLLLN